MSAASRPVSRVSWPALTISPWACAPGRSAVSGAGGLRPGQGQLVLVRLAAQPDVYPGEQFGEGERLGQVVLRAAFEQVDLDRDVGDAGHHEHGLLRPGGQQLGEHLAAVHVADHEVQDDEVVACGSAAAHRIRPGTGVLRRVTLGGERAADERPDPGLVVNDEDPSQMCHAHLPVQSVPPRWCLSVLLRSTGRGVRVELVTRQRRKRLYFSVNGPCRRRQRVAGSRVTILSFTRLGVACAPQRPSRSGHKRATRLHALETG